MTMGLKPVGARVSRRSALAMLGGAALGVTAGLTAARPADASGLPRVAVVGGGMSGVMTAWLLDGHCSVTLLESLPELGGHARSVAWNGHKIDIGAQFFGPRTHPGYWRLLNDVLRVPVVPTPMGITVTQQGISQPVFVSPAPNRMFPLQDPAYAAPLLAMGLFTQAARDLEASGNWTKTIQQFVDELAVGPEMKERLLYPLCATLAGASIAQTMPLSARATVAFVSRSRTLMDDLLTAPFDYYNAVAGLSDVVDHMTAQFSTVTTRLGAAGKVTKLARRGAEWGVWAADADQGGAPSHTVDHVVLALPPEPAAGLVQSIGGDAWRDLAEIYRNFPYFTARVTLHTGPATYMAAGKRNWSAYNTMLQDGKYSEGTMWLGDCREFNVFKSWTTNRALPPSAEIISDATFRHPLLTPGFIANQATLQAWRQANSATNMWFAGTHTVDIDSQESALVSAVRVARELAPGSARLAQL
ncbi:FAD-dependent oxidoreductase [Nocardia sp. NPDC051832]|uniref:FAD-dependent oxidoreductase n=1 Tax=Nocardia sp. NPDC051832 TaxID=3155673 RepID=UPI00341D770C